MRGGQGVMGVSRLHRCAMAGLMLGMLLSNSAPQAHPHHWIDVFAEWQFNPKGLISGVKLRWLFDDYYSVLLVAYAASLGINESGGDELGIQFAETVTIRCE